MEYFLKTRRLGFRCWGDGDYSIAEELWGDGKVTGLFGGPFSPAMVRARLDVEMAHMQRYGFQYWPIFLLENDAHVGCAGLRPYRMEENILELGFHLRPGFWGRGLAPEAARGIIDHAFTTVGAAALFAGHHPENEASRRVLLKVGFVYTGEELYPPSGMIEPTYRMPRAAWSAASSN